MGTTIGSGNYSANMTGGIAGVCGTVPRFRPIPQSKGRSVSTRWAATTITPTPQTTGNGRLYRSRTSKPSSQLSALPNACAVRRRPFFFQRLTWFSSSERQRIRMRVASLYVYLRLNQQGGSEHVAGVQSRRQWQKGCAVSIPVRYQSVRLSRQRCCTTDVQEPTSRRVSYDSVR
jgi:hypothetical protein